MCFHQRFSGISHCGQLHLYDTTHRNMSDHVAISHTVDSLTSEMSGRAKGSCKATAATTRTRAKQKTATMEAAPKQDKVPDVPPAEELRSSSAAVQCLARCLKS